MPRFSISSFSIFTPQFAKRHMGYITPVCSTESTRNIIVIPEATKNFEITGRNLNNGSKKK